MLLKLAFLIRGCLNGAAESPILLHHGHPNKVHRDGLMHLVCCKKHHDMHKVVRVCDEVEGAGKPTLRNVGRANDAATDGKYVLEEARRVTIYRESFVFRQDAVLLT